MRASQTCGSDPARGRRPGILRPITVADRGPGVRAQRASAAPATAHAAAGPGAAAGALSGRAQGGPPGAQQPRARRRGARHGLRQAAGRGRLSGVHLDEVPGAARPRGGRRAPPAGHPAAKKPEPLATKPNQVYSWDITKLLGPVKWTWYYLYVLIDVKGRFRIDLSAQSAPFVPPTGRRLRRSVRGSTIRGMQWRTPSSSPSCSIVAHADRNGSRVIAARAVAVWDAGRQSSAPAA
jgi:hypothetical protein